MTTTEEEKNSEKTILIQEDLDYKIEISTQILDRNISFITNCDNKTSIILSVIGVLFSIILTNERINRIFYIVKSCIEAGNFQSIAYLICLAYAAYIMGRGIVNLIRVLVAETSEKTIGRKYPTSCIFFSGINNYGYKTYYKKFCKMSKEELLKELIEQIYINADIASKKYKKYNHGLKDVTIGSFIVFLLIGIYLMRILL